MASSGVLTLINMPRRIVSVLFQPYNFITRKNTTFKQSFKYDDLILNLSADYSLDRKPDFGDLKFGTLFSDHMLEIEYSEKHGWNKPKIVPMHTINLHPGDKVLHYAQAVFEGMKAFRHKNGKISLFRPDMNMNRLLMSSQRACLPSFDTNELLNCIKKLVSVERNWVPDRELSSMYIRPNFIGVDNTLGVAPARRAMLYVVLCPVGPYFKATIDPISLLADSNYVRACPGGVGAYKMASNYAPTLYLQREAQEQHMDQVLWLIGPDHRITEAGGMNVFFVLKNSQGNIELATPILDGTILPGIVRQSLLDMAREWNEFEVSERFITMKEIITAAKEKRLLEMFVSGTAVSVCPVKLIKFTEGNIEIPTMQRTNPLYARFYKQLTDIQYGRVDSKWSVPIEIE